MKLDLNKEQLELLKYAVLWYESNDSEEEELMQQIEAKIYNAQEDQMLNVLKGLWHKNHSQMRRLKPL